jgi:hypothetical protein
MIRNSLQASIVEIKSQFGEAATFACLLSILVPRKLSSRIHDAFHYHPNSQNFHSLWCGSLVETLARFG